MEPAQLEDRSSTTKPKHAMSNRGAELPEDIRPKAGSAGPKQEVACNERGDAGRLLSRRRRVKPACRELLKNGRASRCAYSGTRVEGFGRVQLDTRKVRSGQEKPLSNEGRPSSAESETGIGRPDRAQFTTGNVGAVHKEHRIDTKKPTAKGSGGDEARPEQAGLRRGGEKPGVTMSGAKGGDPKANLPGANTDRPIMLMLLVEGGASGCKWSRIGTGKLKQARLRTGIPKPRCKQSRTSIGGSEHVLP